MNEKNSVLPTLGTLQVVIGGGLLITFMLQLGSTRTLDDHVQSRGQELAKAMEQQTSVLRDVQNELRKLQEQRRVVDELKAALREAGPAQVPVYVPAGPVQAQPQAPQPQAPQTPPKPPTPPKPETPATAAPGEGTTHAANLGTGKEIPGPDPNAIVGGWQTEAMSEPSTLNYYTTSEGATRQVMMYVLETLFTVSEQDPTKLTPMLATSWEAAPDNLTFTYHLRQGVTWSDGAPFTADDVLFSYATIKDEAVKAESHRGSYVDVESVVKLDDHTVQVKFKRPYWKAMYVFGNSLWIIPKHWYERRTTEVAKAKNIDPFTAEPGKPGFGAAFNQIREPCVGTGPYAVPQGGWIPGENLTLERNPTHWRLTVEPGVWNIQTRKVRFIPDHLAIMNQVRQQKIDTQVVDKDEWIDSLSKDKVITDNYEYKVYDHIGLAFNYITWNCRKFPFDDARVRTAMTHLIDRQGMLRDLWRNEGEVATCPNKRIYPEYNLDLVPHAFDPAKAAALLKAAGFEDHDGDGILDKKVGDEWKRFEFVLKVPSGRAEFERIGNKIKESMEQVGVKCNILPLEWAVFIEHLYDRNFDALCLYSSFSDVWVDHYEDYHSSEDIPRGGNTPGWHSPEVDKLLADMRAEFDREKRIKMYHRFYEILHEQQPQTLLIHGRVTVINHKRFKNVIVRHKGMRSTYWWVDPTWKMPE